MYNLHLFDISWFWFQDCRKKNVLYCAVMVMRIIKKLWIFFFINTGIISQYESHYSFAILHDRSLFIIQAHFLLFNFSFQLLFLFCFCVKIRTSWSTLESKKDDTLWQFWQLGFFFVCFLVKRRGSVGAAANFRPQIQGSKLGRRKLLGGGGIPYHSKLVERRQSCEVSLCE